MKIIILLLISVLFGLFQAKGLLTAHTGMSLNHFRGRYPWRVL